MPINTFCPNCGEKMQARVIWAHPQSTVFCECPKCHTKTSEDSHNYKITYPANYLSESAPEKVAEIPEKSMKTPETRGK